MDLDLECLQRKEKHMCLNLEKNKVATPKVETL